MHKHRFIEMFMTHNNITFCLKIPYFTMRTGVADISVSFSVSPKWLKILTAYSKLPKIAVKYFDTETLDLKDAEMYITGFKAKLEKDTSYKGLWTVSFTLKEM